MSKKEFVPLKEMLKAFEDNNVGKKGDDVLGFLMEVNSMIVRLEDDN